MLRVGVIGYGYWGPNLVRNLSEVAGCRVPVICDSRPDRRQQAARRHPVAEVVERADELIRSPKIDAVVVATPVSNHFELALGALEEHKHVLVEKPLAGTADECRRLLDAAAERGLVLLVDHTFAYTGAVRKAKELIDAGKLGDIYYYDAVRVNLGLFQHDVGVIWDLAVHDLSIMDYLFEATPEAVSATGVSHVAGQPENIAYLTVFFEDQRIAHIHVNWLAPVKVRRILIGGSRNMIVYDDLETTEKIKVYDRGVDLTDDPESMHEMLVGYRTGDMWAPKLSHVEALRTLAEHFVACCTRGEEPITGGESGLRVVRMMEAATRSMEQKGALVPIDHGP